MNGQMPQLSARDLAQRLSGAEPPVVVDVRNPPEIAAEGAIAGALQIPLNELPSRLAELPRDREIVCVCKMGMRSFNAAGFLRQQGYRAANMAGGMNAWLAASLPVKR